ncbi:MAG: AmmeMemoRadiSam system radical SAM enzyme [Anaerolineaceae bacterium]
MIDNSELDRFTHEGELFTQAEAGSVRCIACEHRCLIRLGKRGICGVRFNLEGHLRVPWGYVAGAQVDPIEKKPFNHFLPGSQVLTFGMLGCNFHCSFCQNWETSQVMRDPCAGQYLQEITEVTPEELVKAAVRKGAGVVASSYNEPIITSEWAAAIFQEAKKHALKTVCVSNGYATPEALKYLRPWLDGYKIDLKSMQEKRYREMGGVLKHVLDSIHVARELGLWVEVVTLVIPGFNDSVEELWNLSRFLASESADIPWHVTAYHPDYQMSDAPATSAATLQRAAEIGEEAGLHYVYAGNLPGKVGSLEDTNCPGCGKRLIQRQGYWISENRITTSGTCPDCGQKIPGVWA